MLLYSLHKNNHLVVTLCRMPGCSTAGKASLVMNVVLLISLLVGGFFVNVASIPGWIRWLHYLSVFFYSYAILITNEVATLSLNFAVSVATPIGGLTAELYNTICRGLVSFKYVFGNLPLSCCSWRAMRR